jgi:serine/threonine protein kinase
MYAHRQAYFAVFPRYAMVNTAMADAIVCARRRLIASLLPIGDSPIACGATSTIWPIGVDGSTVVKFIDVCGIDSDEPLGDPCDAPTMCGEMRPALACERVRREWYTIKALSYTHGVPALLCDEASSVAAAAIVMTRCYATLATRDSRVPLSWIDGLSLQLCQVIHAAHTIGMTHGDLHAHQVLLSTDNDGVPRAYVCDWSSGDVGSAHVQPPPAPRDTAVADAGVSADQWALGCLMLGMLCGKACPFATELECDTTPEALATAHLRIMGRDPRSPRALLEATLGAPVPDTDQRLRMRTLAAAHRLVYAHRQPVLADVARLLSQ